tara:strand:+ start:61 stop:399 length:339 start_codon:yes stop_codon:yes gene_type:complete
MLITRVFLKKISRSTYKLIGIVLAIFGVVVAMFGALIMEPGTYEVTYWSEEMGNYETETGTTPYQKYLVGGFGVALLFLGYRSYRFIPLAERDTQHVTEAELYGEESESSET